VDAQTTPEKPIFCLQDSPAQTERNFVISPQNGRDLALIGWACQWLTMLHHRWRLVNAY